MTDRMGDPTDSEDVRTRRSMLAQAAGLTAAAGLGLAGVNRALAQKSTPATGGSGDAVEFKNVEGIVVATLAVNSVTDPFSGYNPAYSAAARPAVHPDQRRGREHRRRQFRLRSEHHLHSGCR